MKKIVYILMLSLFSHLFALDEVSSIDESQKKVIDRVVEVLGLPNTTSSKEIVYDKLSTFFTEGWSAHWTTNDTGVDSKITKSTTQICDVTIYNNNRVVNTTFVYFAKEKQLFITLKQYIEAESSTVMDLYKKTKADTKYEVQNETDNYAYFQEKGYMSYNTYHIKAPVGMVIYESSYFINIK